MWRFYEDLGSVHYGVNFKKNAATKVRFFAAEHDPDVDDPIETDNQQAIDTVGRLRSRFGDINEIVAELMVHINLVGEGYLVGIDGLEGEEWDVWSVEEVQAAANANMPLPDQAVLEGDTYAARIWRPSPRNRHLADAPLRPVRQQCEQLLLLDDSISALARSRLSAGLFYIPSELDIGDQTAFEDEVIAVLTTPIKDSESAARWAPGIIRGPAEFSDKFAQFTFGRDIDPVFAALREELVRAIAAGLDLPAEIVTGMGDMTHWNAWMLDESAFRDHIDPDLILIMESLTRGYLQPALIEGGMADEEADRYLIWRDLSDLGQRPPTIPEATALWDRGILSNDYMLGLVNATEEDAPEVAPNTSDAGAVPAVGEGIARGEPGQDQTVSMGAETEPLAQRVNAVGILIRSGFDPEAALKAMGLPPITHLGFLPVTIKTDVPPDPAAAILDPNAPPPEAKTPAANPFPQVEVETIVAAAPKLRPLTELANIDRMLLERITEASEAGFNRVLERAGAKIRSHAKKDRAISASIDRIPNDQVTLHLGEALTRQLQITPQDLVPEDSFDPLTKRLRVIMAGAAEQVAETLEGLTGEKPEPDDSRIQAAITAFVATLSAFALRLLFKPQEPGPGEVGTSVIPATMVEDMLTQAGGAIPTAGPSNVRGFATGADSLEWITGHGIRLAGHQWEYGDASTRHRPFPPHRALNGVQFTDWDDPRLQTPASASFLNVGHMFPGDHFLCQCSTVPVIVEQDIAA